MGRYGGEKEEGALQHSNNVLFLDRDLNGTNQYTYQTHRELQLRSVHPAECQFQLKKKL